jgi:hypothetical protein
MANAKRLRKRQDAHLKAPSHLYLRKTDALVYFHWPSYEKILDPLLH